MRTYNYLSNELPRELIGIYDDLEQDLLKIIVKQLKMGIEPIRVAQNIRDKVAEYDPKIQKVIAVVFADIKKRAVKDGKEDFKQEPTDQEALNNNEANKVISPQLIAAFGIATVLSNRIAENAINEYTTDYLTIQNKVTRLTKTFDPLQSIIKRLAKQGIKVLSNGKLRSIDGLVREDLMYETTRANARINYDNLKNSSAKFVEVSSHPTARTWTKYMTHDYEDHSSWQGQVYYSGEPVEGYDEFESTCGYGEMLGICGINCYHQFQMNYTGEGTQEEYSIKEVRKNYELSQEQRAYERAIRKMKQARAVYEEAGDVQMTKQLSGNITNATNKLKTFCEKNNLKYVNWRTQI